VNILTDNITALFYAINVLLLFVDAFDKLTVKITQFITDICLCHSILSPLCKFNSDIPNGCQRIANLLRGYVNLSHPAYGVTECILAVILYMCIVYSLNEKTVDLNDIQDIMPLPLCSEPVSVYIQSNLSLGSRAFAFLFRPPGTCSHRISVIVHYLLVFHMHLDSNLTTVLYKIIYLLTYLHPWNLMGLFDNILCHRWSRLAGDTMLSTCLFFFPSNGIHLCVHLFTRYQPCKQDSLKTNELISMQTGTSGPRVKDVKWSTLGVRRSKVKVTGGRNRSDL